MSVKTAGVGHFQIPTAPAAGTSVTSGAANVYTTTPVQLIASTAAALYITGIYAEEAAVSTATYKSVQLMIGAAASETVIGQYEIAPSTGSTVTRTFRNIFPPIPVAIGIRISAKTGDSVGALATLISLECIAQSNVVDDGIAITTVSAVTGLTASNLDATISSRMASYTQPTGFLAATFPTGTVANTTNITAGTMTTTTNLTNAPTAGDFTATMKTSIGTAVAASAVASVTAAVSVAGDFSATMKTSLNAATPASVTGNVGGNVVGSVASVTAAVTLPSIPANWITAAGINAAALNGKGDWNIGKTGYTLTQTFPANFSSLSITAGGLLDLTQTAADKVWGTATRALTDKTGFALSAAYDAAKTAAQAGNAMTLTAAYDSAKTAAPASDVTAIKAKTDSLAFTVANQIDANIRSVNGTTITGAGTAGSSWGP